MLIYKMNLLAISYSISDIESYEFSIGAYFYTPILLKKTSSTRKFSERNDSFGNSGTSTEGLVDHLILDRRTCRLPGSTELCTMAILQALFMKSLH